MEENGHSKENTEQSDTKICIALLSLRSQEARIVLGKRTGTCICILLSRVQAGPVQSWLFWVLLGFSAGFLRQFTWTLQAVYSTRAKLILAMPLEPTSLRREAIVQIRKLIGFCCVTAVLILNASSPDAHGETPAAVRGVAPNAPQKNLSGRNAGAEDAAKSSSAVQVSNADPAYLVREVVYNELHDHDTHGYWRYWVERQSNRKTRLEEAVETRDGPVARLELSDGRPLSAEMRAEEESRLQHLIGSPAEQAQHRKEYAEDEHRVGRILALLPNAFLYEPAGEEEKSERTPECPCYHLRFRPNPSYPAHSIESRIFHAMAGDLWISVDHKRLVRLDGKLKENVDFGYGFLGRLNKDGWFRLERTHVSGETGAGDWKTERLEIHMTGRAMLFKTIARETSEVRGGFTPVPSGLTVQQASMLAHEPTSVSLATRPASLVTSR